MCSCVFLEEEKTALLDCFFFQHQTNTKKMSFLSHIIIIVLPNHTHTKSYQISLSDRPKDERLFLFTLLRRLLRLLRWQYELISSSEFRSPPMMRPLEELPSRRLRIMSSSRRRLSKDPPSIKLSAMMLFRSGVDASSKNALIISLSRSRLLQQQQSTLVTQAEMPHTKRTRFLHTGRHNQRVNVDI